MSMARISKILSQIKSNTDIGEYRFADVHMIVEVQKQLLDSLSRDNIPQEEKEMISKLITDIFPQLIKIMLNQHKKAKAKTWKSLQNSLENNMYDSLLNNKKSLRDDINDLISYDFATWDPEAEDFLKTQLRNTISSLFQQNLLKWTTNICSNVSLDYQYSKNIEKELKYFMEQWYLDDQSYTYAHELISNAYIQDHFKQVYEKKHSIVQELRHAQKTKDIFVPIAILIDEMNDVIYKKNEELAWDEEEAKFFIKLCDDVKDSYTKEIYTLCEIFVNTVISEDIETLHSKEELEAYWQKDIIKQWKSLLNFLSEDKKTYLIWILEDLKKEQLLTLQINLPKIKVRWDEVHFGSAVFPRFLYKPNSLWKAEPEIVDDNVHLNIKDIKSWKIIKASDEKKIRPENPYKMTEEEYKKMMKEYTTFHKTQECNELFAEEVRLTDSLIRFEDKKSAEYQELQMRLHEVRDEIEKNIPHYFRVIRKINAMPWLFSALKKAPELNSKIVIPPSVMEILHKIVHLSEYQLLTQDWFGILEWEAGVGKNVAIDIFAHYTGRPVFNFACNEKTTKDDMTYLWLIDKNGTYKLNSEVVKAIETEWAILVLDEINSLRPEVAKLLNSLLDMRRKLYFPHSDTSKKAKESVLIFGTMNPNTHVYKWNNVLSAEISSRAFFQFIDYPSLITDNIVNYDEALMTYKNVPYFYKLLSKEGFTQSDVDEIKYYIIREHNGNWLREDQKEKISKMQDSYLSDREFIQVWNDIINKKQTSSYNPEFIKWIESINEILLYAHYFRSKYIQKMTGIDRSSKITSSVSQRDLNKMLYLLCLWYTPEKAFIEVYINSIPSLSDRETIKNDLKTLSRETVLEEVKNYWTNKNLKLETLFNQTPNT